MVSIHAPGWVRQQHDNGIDSGFMFQSTHPFGCDNRGRAIDILIPRFNPRTRLGATALSLISLLAVTVSIHAPVWVRPPLFYHVYRSLSFQSTHPFGCDSIKPDDITFGWCFNPRTRLGATAKIIFFRFFLLYRCA